MEVENGKKKTWHTLCLKELTCFQTLKASQEVRFADYIFKHKKIRKNILKRKTLIYGSKKCPKVHSQQDIRYHNWQSTGCFASVLLDYRICLWALPFGNSMQAGKPVALFYRNFMHAAYVIPLHILVPQLKLFLQPPFLQHCYV